MSMKVTVNTPGGTSGNFQVFVLTGASGLTGTTSHSTGGGSGSGPWDYSITITPTYSNSLLLATIITNAGSYSADSGTTIYSQSSSGITLYYNANPVTAGTGYALGLNQDSANYSYQRVVAEYGPSGGSTPAIDASTPNPVQISSNSSTTASFAPPAGAMFALILQTTSSTAAVQDSANHNWIPVIESPIFAEYQYAFIGVPGTPDGIVPALMTTGIV